MRRIPISAVMSINKITSIKRKLNFIKSNIFLRKNNQDFIVFVYNLVFYWRTKYINLEHYYIWDKMAAGRIKLI